MSPSCEDWRLIDASADAVSRAVVTRYSSEPLRVVRGVEWSEGSGSRFRWPRVGYQQPTSSLRHFCDSLADRPLDSRGRQFSTRAPFAD